MDIILSNEKIFSSTFISFFFQENYVDHSIHKILWLFKLSFCKIFRQEWNKLNKFNNMSSQICEIYVTP